jgi:hypothetical protein
VYDYQLFREETPVTLGTSGGDPNGLVDVGRRLIPGDPDGVNGFRGGRGRSDTVRP